LGSSIRRHYREEVAIVVEEATSEIGLPDVSHPLEIRIKYASGPDRPNGQPGWILGY
jgi:hypothetical protein